MNPPVAVAGATVPTPRAARSAKDYLAIALATCGVGYLPLAPGTFGSLVGVGVYVVVRGVLLRSLSPLTLEFKLNLFHLYYAIAALELLVVLALGLAGIWAASRTETLSGKKDPGKVVIDEVVGQFIALIPVPFLIDLTWWSAILAFALFRIFDIVKPYPARRLESLPGGLGIMADDVVAGAYAALGVMLAVTMSWII